MRTFDSQRLRHQRAMDARLTADHRQLARLIAGLVVRAATGRSADGTPIIPATRAQRDALKAAVWDILRSYYIGPGTDALRGAEPQSPYARLLVEGIEKATRIQAERQVAIVRRLCKDDAVTAWLTGPRNVLAVREMSPVGYSGRITELTAIPVGQPARPGMPPRTPGRVWDISRLVSPKGMYEPFHQFVDPNGYRLSDRIWTTSINVRSRIDLLLDTEIARGTSAVGIANLLEPFMTPGGRASKTQKPYGSEGSYAARRLARTEITAAAGRATVNAAAANPFVERLQWRTSGSHPKPDECDANAHGGPNGDGIYPIGSTPRYPSHPNCLCSLLPVPTGSTADLVATLRADIQAARGSLIDAASGGNAARGRALQGLLNPDYLTQAMMSGNLEQAVNDAAIASQRMAGRVAKPPPIPKAAPVAPKVVAAAQKDRTLPAIRQRLSTVIAPQVREIEAIEAEITSITNQINEAYKRYTSSTRGEADESLRSLVNDVWPKQIKALRKQIEPLTGHMRQELLREIELPEGKRANVILHLDNVKAGKARDDLRVNTDQAADFINRITAVSQFPNDKFNIVVDSHAGRAFASAGKIAVSSKTPIRTIVHEIGHNIETKRGGAGRSARVTFYESRTAGEKSVRLKKLVPNASYAQDEITKKDNWQEPYTGKIYPHDTDSFPNSEVVSTGLEALYAEPHKLIRDDPGFFDFLINYLQGD